MKSVRGKYYWAALDRLTGGELPEPQVSGAGEALSPTEWERRLTAHYLREDGPFGGAPLECLDATPAEIALAAGLVDADDAEVQASFLAQFGAGETAAWLDGRRTPSRNAELPGYFRHLVLTALVSATDQGAGDSRDFRKRLGELLKHGGPFQAVSGVNRLWRALAAWSETRRAAGEPIRRVMLPSAGRASWIGVAVAIAFPSWRDRQTLTRILEGLSPAVRRSPRRLAAELSRPHYDGLCSPNVAVAFEDFTAGLAQGRADLADHRFWRLVESVSQRLEDRGNRPAVGRWRLEATFGGAERDQLEVDVTRRVARGQRGSVLWSGPFEAFLSAAVEALPTGLARLRDRGLLVLGEAPGGIWVVDDLGPHEAWSSVILSRADGLLVQGELATPWTPVGGGWVASDPLGSALAEAAVQAAGLAPRSHERLVELGLEGGVPTRRGSWLGRPAFLPHVRAPAGAELALVGEAGHSRGLALDDRGNLIGDRPLTGTWTLAARAGGAEADRTFRLEADAPERDGWPEFAPDLEAPEEILCDADAAASQPGIPLLPATSPALLDLMEALYARGSTVWAEAEFVELLERVLPVRRAAWDVMRAFAEAGWAEVGISRRWRARRWRLCPPSLLPLGPLASLVEGAVGSASRRRLAGTVAALGGRVLSGGDLEWSPDVVIVLDVAPSAVAAAMEWPTTTAEIPLPAPAPACWPREPRTVEGRDLAGTWSFEIGGFLREPGVDEPWRLERWVRERGDDRDLFRLIGPNGVEWATTSATAALLEAHRRAGRPLFVWSAGELTRRGGGGHLPLPIARALRRSTLRQTGPVITPEGGRGYRYPANIQDASQIAGLFGAAVSVRPAAAPRAALAHVIARRREGLRPTWYEPVLERTRR